MPHPGNCFRLTLFLILLLGIPRLWAQGPPYQTDDPVPVDLPSLRVLHLRRVDGTPAEIDSTGPAFEFNWGAIPRVQLHAILPWGMVAPSNNPVYLPGGTGSRAFGLYRHGIGREGRHHQTDQKLSADRHLHHVRNAHRKLYQRPRRGKGMVQNFPSGWKRIGSSGPFVAAAVIRWSRRPGTATCPYTGWLLKRTLSERLGAGS